MLRVSPSTGLVGGEQLKVSLSGFPAHVTVSVYECAGVPSATTADRCGGTTTTLYTGESGSVSGPFIAEPAAGTASKGTTVTCQKQCVLAGVVIKQAGRVPLSPAPMAQAPLSFSTTATPGLADAFLADLSWVSTGEGWALATRPCATGSTGTCAVLAHTSDGGAHWQTLPTLPTTGTVGCDDASCVGSVAFANSSLGYLYGPELLMTSNGGRSWQAEPGLQVETLTVADGAVYRVAYDQSGCPGPCQPTLQEAAVGSSVWQTLVGELVSPDRSDSAQIVSSGTTLLVAMYGSQAGPFSAQAVLYRSTNAGGSFEQRSDPCSGMGPAGTEEDLIDLASAPGGFFAGLCSPHSGSGTFVVTSSDDGSSWQRAGALPGAGDQWGLLAAASATALAVATGSISGGGPYTARLLVSTDAGRSWTSAATDAQEVTSAGVPGWLGFETSQVGRWISDPHNVWTTNDGGQHWARIAFG
jgi:photosystem II stability/assembly factor-like uncharacterized protein